MGRFNERGQPQPSVLLCFTSPVSPASGVKVGDFVLKGDQIRWSMKCKLCSLLRVSKTASEDVHVLSVAEQTGSYR